ncbi:MAG: hypothetical protein QNJ46_25950 [Leptolyngbyaceae cyanobacterium MO_188.B28]|nr:hypothetical protein [Leptolyngbyaceae cyanobacterium MO_188.B28]
MLFVANKMLCAMLIAALKIGFYQPIPHLSLNNHNQLENSMSAKLANAFSLRVNQVAQIESENLELKLLEVKSDSRCPSGVQCIWPGLVEIVIHVKTDNQAVELILIDQAGDANLASQTFDGYLIELVEVTPYSQKDQAIEIEDYSATLVVSGE